MPLQDTRPTPAFGGSGIRTRSYNLHACDNLSVPRGIDSNSVNLTCLNPLRHTDETRWGPEIPGAYPTTIHGQFLA